MSDAKVLHKEFAARLELACEANPHVPPQNYGRLGWIATNLEERFGVKVSVETVRRWCAGESRPRPDKLAILCNLLQADEAWLSLGTHATVSAKESKLRSAQADGAVNIVAGIVQATGGNPAFPTEDDSRAAEDLVDLYVIIGGKQFALHVVSGSDDGDVVSFAVPTKAENTRVIGVIVQPGLALEFYALPWDTIKDMGAQKSGAYHITVGRELFDEIGIARITSFADLS